MLFEKIHNSELFSDRRALITPDATCSWSELARLTTACQKPLEPFTGHRIGLLMHRHPAAIAGLAACQARGCNVFLLEATAAAEDIQRLAEEFQLSAIVRASTGSGSPLEITMSESEAAPDASVAGITILTSGTEGRPKAARHSWASLARPIRATDSAERQVWLLSFRLDLYAGMQVMLQCLANYGTLVMPSEKASPDEIVTMMRDQTVGYASATPSYWRRLVLMADRDIVAAAPLKQITLGGEAVDQQILDSLVSIFPQSRIAHIYATTELGRCFSVTDGQAGFPEKLLDAPSADGIQLRVEDGELMVRSANRMSGYEQQGRSSGAVDDQSSEEASSDWFATGDLVEQFADRIYFAGRRTEMINVGGNKVSPLAVENVIRSVEGVADARVYGKSSSIAGQLVACDLAVNQGEDSREIRERVIQRCQVALADIQQPRIVQIVDSISLTSSSKTARRDSIKPETN